MDCGSSGHQRTEGCQPHLHVPGTGGRRNGRADAPIHKRSWPDDPKEAHPRAGLRVKEILVQEGLALPWDGGREANEARTRHTDHF